MDATCTSEVASQFYHASISHLMFFATRAPRVLEDWEPLQLTFMPDTFAKVLQGQGCAMEQSDAHISKMLINSRQSYDTSDHGWLFVAQA